MVFHTNGGIGANGGASSSQVTEKMRITPNGSVGIGTSTPQGRLEVWNGASYFNNGRIDGTFGDQLFFGSAPSGYGTTYLHKIRTSHSSNTSLGGMIFSLSNGTASAYNDVLTLRENGNVGIGTTTPESRLQVSGSIYANTTADIT